MLSLLMLSGCSPIALLDAEPAEPTIRSWQAAVDWDAAGDEAVAMLSAYLRVDTVNPPGNETRGAEFLAEYLSREGIPWTIHEFAAGRGSLVAKLEGSGQQGPVCLLSHIDVVPSEDALWPPDKGPLSGVIDEDGVIWGRGALDMKGMGAIELMTLLLLKRGGVPLKRDVILLAVADEEVAGRGVQHLAAEHWDEIGCEYVINEGGIGLEDLLFEGQDVFPVSVGEKGFLWLKIIASGEPGHGSVPRTDTSTYKLRQVLKRLERYEPEPAIPEALLETLALSGRQQGGALEFVLGRPALARLAVKGTLTANPLTLAGITDTLNVTGFGGASSPNVLPGEVWLQIDSRLLPGTSPQDMEDRIRAMIADIEGVRIERINSYPAGITEWRGDPFYQALTRNLTEDRDDVVAGPVISVGFTDSLYLRPLGVKAFGLVPFMTDQQGIATMHGNRERVSSENVRQGLRLLYETILEVSADAGGALEPPPWGSTGAASAAPAPAGPTGPEVSPWVVE